MTDPPSSNDSHQRSVSQTPTASQMEHIAQQLAVRVSEHLPGILGQLLHEGFDLSNAPLHLECSLTTNRDPGASTQSRVQIAAVDLGRELTPYPVNNGTPFRNQPQHAGSLLSSSLGPGTWNPQNVSNATTPAKASQAITPRSAKRRRTTAVSRNVVSTESSNTSTDVALIGDGDGVDLARKKRTLENPVHQPSTLEKYISGVWESLYSGPRIDITEVVEQWQAIESSGQPKLLTDVENEVATRNESGGACKYSIILQQRPAHGLSWQHRFLSLAPRHG